MSTLVLYLNFIHCFIRIGYGIFGSLTYTHYDAHWVKTVDLGNIVKELVKYGQLVFIYVVVFRVIKFCKNDENHQDRNVKMVN